MKHRNTIVEQPSDSRTDSFTDNCSQSFKQ